ncbi:MAG TPA: hypothetical protein EYQ50_20155 [Verrucomicrobiales bacterium]|nr:hypothetical protein [Verrucomicrobiales bacterium]HIL71039.1 hypothetical protein [Verrucomicrobiota bacterium]
MVKAVDRRRAARNLIQEHQISQRRACRLIDLSRNALEYQSCKSADSQLRRDLVQAAGIWPRWGFPTLLDQMRRKGWKDNHKRVYRIYPYEPNYSTLRVADLIER